MKPRARTRKTSLSPLLQQIDTKTGYPKKSPLLRSEMVKMRKRVQSNRADAIGTVSEVVRRLLRDHDARSSAKHSVR